MTSILKRMYSKIRCFPARVGSKMVILAAMILPTLTACANWFNPTRPQTPKERLYHVEKVVIKGAEKSVELHGELTAPSLSGQYPAVLLIVGSGPMDRDESFYGHYPYMVLADRLTKAGYSVFRYDKRGVGESSGDYNKATMEDFAQDAVAAVDWLSQQPMVDPNRIGLIGHSSGGMVATIAARYSEKVKHTIMIASPFSPLEEVLSLQNREIARVAGKDADWIQTQELWLRRYFSIAKEATDINLALEQIEREFKPYAKTLKLSKNHMSNLLTALPLPWWHHALNYQQKAYLAELDIPMLAIFGGKDLQVSAEMNAQCAQAWLLHNKSRVEVFPDLNHMLQPSETGNPEEYLDIDITMDEGAIRSMVEWLNLVNGHL